MYRNATTLLILLLLFCASIAVHAQDQADQFTFQGYLEEGGTPVNGTCDFRFNLYDSATGTNTLSAPYNATNVSVDEGVFNALIYFDPQLFDGADRWLGIEVDCGAGFTTLSRQAFNATPYSLFAQRLQGLNIIDNATSPNLIAGFDGNSIAAGIVGATISGGGASGAENTVNNNYGTIGGGRNNTVGDASQGPNFETDATVSGGRGNSATFRWSTVGGGDGNTASAFHATVSGGDENNALGNGSTVGGGINNRVDGVNATVAGGNENEAFADHSTVGGGEDNLAQGLHAVIAGGRQNQATGEGSTVGGGVDNEAKANYATISGGGEAENDSGRLVIQFVSGDYGTISGGGANSVYDDFGVVGGGRDNTVGVLDEFTTRQTYATIGGGLSNEATEAYATVAGGIDNVASGFETFIGGGQENHATAEGAVVAGGSGNEARGTYATVPGGIFNEAIGSGSFAAGAYARAVGFGTFVWSSDGLQTYQVSESDVFAVEADGLIFTDDPSVTTVGNGNFINTGTGATLSNGGTWTNNSDRAAKTALETVDTQAVLDALAELPITTWRYHAEDGTRHMGPMAQDFYAAFGLGADETSISTVDADGVALAAVQGLHAEVEALQASVQQQQIVNVILLLGLAGLTVFVLRQTRREKAHVS
jgi:trimeric autotransporter adhesin